MNSLLILMLNLMIKLMSLITPPQEFRREYFFPARPSKSPISRKRNGIFRGLGISDASDSPVQSSPECVLGDPSLDTLFCSFQTSRAMI